MKNTFFLFLLILLSFITNGQKISIINLTNIQKSNSDSFEKLAQQKGFEYTSTNIDSDYTSISYSHYNLNGKSVSFPLIQPVHLELARRCIVNFKIYKHEKEAYRRPDSGRY